MGSTDCIALYPEARKFGAEVDVYVTDQGHNIGTIAKRIEEFHNKNPNIPKPKAAIIVDYSGNRSAQVKNMLESELIRCGIPVSIIQPEALKESALVSQSVRAALVGELAVIEEILNTPLPNLPKWWNRITTKSKVEKNTALCSK
jgi:superfamily I DNA/RNA helicase